MMNQESRKPVLIGVTGGTASGKTSLCMRIAERIGLDCTYLALDSFYKGLTESEHDDADNYNFDHPNAIDFDFAYETLISLMGGKDCQIPIYSFQLHRRTEETVLVKSQPIILFEGILSLYEKRFRDMMNIRIFVLTDDDTRLSRRLLRDCAERGRSVEGVLFQYNRFVKKSYDEYIKPTMKHADIIVPFGSDNTTAIDFIVQNLRFKLKQEQKRRRQLAQEQEILESLSPTKGPTAEPLTSLEFELVDYAIDYSGFKHSVAYYAAGNKINYKLEIILKRVIEKAEQLPLDFFVSQFSYHIIKLFKENHKDPVTFIQSGKQYYAKERIQNQQVQELIKDKKEIALFYPELLSQAAIDDLKGVMDEVEKKMDNIEKIQVLCFLGTFWMLMQLKDHSVFGRVYFYVIAFNDMLREYDNLYIMQNNTQDGSVLTKELCFKIFFAKWQEINH